MIYFSQKYRVSFLKRNETKHQNAFRPPMWCIHSKYHFLAFFINFSHLRDQNDIFEVSFICWKHRRHIQTTWTYIIGSGSVWRRDSNILVFVSLPFRKSTMYKLYMTVKLLWCDVYIYNVCLLWNEAKGQLLITIIESSLNIWIFMTVSLLGTVHF